MLLKRRLKALSSNNTEMIIARAFINLLHTTNCGRCIIVIGFCAVFMACIVFCLSNMHVRMIIVIIVKITLQVSTQREIQVSL